MPSSLAEVPLKNFFSDGKKLTAVCRGFMVHSMNNKKSTLHISGREVVEFQGLIESLFQCCQERMQYQSERFELPEAELRCLLQFRNERYLTAKAVAGRLNVAKSRVTKLVDGLLKRQHIERIDDPGDSRVKLLKLTSQGERLVTEIVSLREQLHLKVLEQFVPEQRALLLNVLFQLRQSMESVKEMLI